MIICGVDLKYVNYNKWVDDDDADDHGGGDDDGDDGDDGDDVEEMGKIRKSKFDFFANFDADYCVRLQIAPPKTWR